jgi:hypothetical protein
MRPLQHTLFAALACYARPRWPSLHAPAGTSTTLETSHGLDLVVLDRHVGSVVISQHLQHHGLDSPSGHRLGRKL